MSVPIRIGISTCLLGENVRYDGGHNRDRFITDTLGRYVQWVPVCPEVECGMGIPRETLRLVGSPDSPRLFGDNPVFRNSRPKAPSGSHWFTLSRV